MIYYAFWKITAAGMASKGLSSSMYQAIMHFIESTRFALPRTPLFAIPVVSNWHGLKVEI